MKHLTRTCCLLLILPKLALANCEAGAYTIHTVANYKATSINSEIYMIYKVESGTLQAKMNAIDVDKVRLKSLPNPLTLKFGNETCALSAHFFLDPSYAADDPYSSEYPLRLNLNGCAELVAKAANKAYLRFDVAKKTLELAKILPINSLAPESTRIKEIEKEIKKDALSRKFFLFRPLETSKNETGQRPLKKEDIINFRMEAVEVGRGPDAFVMAIGILGIKEIKSSFVLDKGEMSVEDYNASLEANRLKNEKADFPTIYFKAPTHSNFTFIGDGSICSYAKFQKYPAPVNGAEGSFDRFHISNAFDLNGDSRVDVLEINSRFVYRLLSNGIPEVIDYGQGC